MSLRARSLLFGLLLLLAAALWGSSFPAYKVGLERFDAWDLMWWSRALGAVALGAVVLSVPSARRAIRPALIVPSLVLGGILFVATSIQTAGLQHTTATNAAFITVMYVVITPLLGALWQRKAPSSSTLGIAVLALVGLGLMSITSPRISPGDGIVLVSTLFWSAQVLAVGHWAPRFHPLALTFGQVAASAVMHLIVALPGGLHAGVAVHSVLILLMAGVLASGGAYLLQFTAISIVEPSRAALLLAFESVFAFVVAALWLGERMNSRQVVGALVMLSAIVISEVLHARSTAIERTLAEAEA